MNTNSSKGMIIVTLYLGLFKILKYKYMKKRFFIILMLVLSTTAFVVNANPNDANANNLVKEVDTKISELNVLLKKAKKKKIDVSREECALWMANTFMLYAAWDENNVKDNETQFKTWPTYKADAEKLAVELPTFERNEVKKMLETSIEELKAVIDGKYVRRAVPAIDWTNIKRSGNQFVNDKRPVFINDYFTKPDFMSNEYLGKVDRLSLALSALKNVEGDLSTNGIKISNHPSKNSGYVLLWHGVPPTWGKTIDPEISLTGRHFTMYDIDNPTIRKMWEQTFASTIPLMKNKAYTDLGYILANEPHWFTKEKTWATGPVSKYTLENFKKWLQNKHKNIDRLNTLWETKYASFDEIDFKVPFPDNISKKPAGYDWMTFNMERVTDWFTFLNNGIKKYDPNAQTHIKIVPRLFTGGLMDHGIDMEALTELSDAAGNDAKIMGKQVYSKNKEYWEGYYSFNWKEMAMSYDFYKSVAPDKPNVNSESHFLSSSGYRDLYMKPEFVRTAYWLATLHGMNVNFSWFWAREEDGAIRSDLRNYNGPDNAMSNAYVGSVVQQPRVANEVTKTMMDVNAFAPEMAQLQNLKKPVRLFYSKTNAIRSGTISADNLYELYRSLYFEGLSLGFVTEKIINKQNNSDWDHILIANTECVTVNELDALRNYLKNGGTIIMDKASLLKNEYGEALPYSLLDCKGQIIIKDNMKLVVAESLSRLNSKDLMPTITIHEKNAIGTKGCTWRSLSTDNKSSIVSISNIGASKATLTVGDKNRKIKSVKNLFNGTELGVTFDILPDVTLLLEVQ